MKKIIWLIIGLPVVVYAQQERGIHFENNLSWEKIKTKAKEENKYIFVDVFATWCAPCKLMDKQIYPSDSLGNSMNNRFISVKVQMDTNINDNQWVKSWYKDARAIKEQYNIFAYPSLLFFTPDAKLIYQDIGFKTVSELIKSKDKVLNPKTAYYYTLLENYKKGERNYEMLYDLALYAKRTGDRQLAKQIATDYINHADKMELTSRDNILFTLNIAENRIFADSLAREYKKSHFDKLSTDELCTKENFSFINSFYSLITSNDKIFQLCYYHPETVDSVMGYKWANVIVDITIKREELSDKLWRDGVPVFKKPLWEKVTNDIQTKYGKIDAAKLVLEYKISYYRKLLEWQMWAKAFGEQIRKYPPKPGDGFWKLNLPAWDAFLHCIDRKVLKEALKWSSLSIQIDVPNPNFQCFDTRANLLYKLGRVREAVNEEKKGIVVANEVAKKQGKQKGSFVDQYAEIIDLMKKGKPTYLEEGAEWNHKQ